MSVVLWPWFKGCCVCMIILHLRYFVFCKRASVVWRNLGVLLLHTHRVARRRRIWRMFKRKLYEAF